MDTENQISQEELRRICAAYAAVCLERPHFLYMLSGWHGRNALNLLESKTRLLSEFDETKQTSLDDLIGLELAGCYAAEDAGRHDVAVERLYRVVAVVLRAIRLLKVLTNPEEASAVDTSVQG